jgi:hypothetical protein
LKRNFTPSKREDGNQRSLSDIFGRRNLQSNIKMRGLAIKGVQRGRRCRGAKAKLAWAAKKHQGDLLQLKPSSLPLLQLGPCRIRTPLLTLSW